MRQVRGRWWKRLLGLGAGDDDWPDDPRGAGRADGTDPDWTRDPDFALALYGRLAARPGNLVLSPANTRLHLGTAYRLAPGHRADHAAPVLWPANTRLALGMAYAGAAGQTADEMARVLCLPRGHDVHAEMTAQLDA